MQFKQKCFPTNLHPFERDEDALAQVENKLEPLLETIEGTKEAEIKE